MTEAEALNPSEFDDRYHDWWTPNYWEAVIESQQIAVPGSIVEVYGTSTSRRGARWTLYLRKPRTRGNEHDR